LVTIIGQPVRRASSERLDMTVPFAKRVKIGGMRILVAAGLEAIQPVLNIAGAPADFARTNVARAWEVAAARAAIQGGSRFEASDVKHVGDG
jgi:hypothetical protein